MKQTLFLILFILVFGQLCHFGLPWWAAAPIGGLAGWLFPQPAGKILIAGFAAGFLWWVLPATWLDMANSGILSGRVGALFMGLPGTALVLLTGMLGGLLTGFGALTGRWARDLVRQPAKPRYR